MRLKALLVSGVTLMAASVGPAAYAQQATLMPLPAAMSAGTGLLLVDGGFTVALAGPADPHLDAAARTLIQRLSAKTGQFLAGAPVTKGQATLTLTVTGVSAAVPAPKEDEAYTLTVTPGGASITAATSIGINRGVATFAQLVANGPQGWAVPAVTVHDQPRFPWRGLLLDVSRHFMPIATVERTIDLMQAVKLNVLHWHLSDNQGFRVESKVFPRLHQLGSDGDFYTQDQVRQVIRYAADRGIRVVPEFDMPGHTTVWLVGYPELASAPGPYAIERHWGVFDPALDPTRDSTYQFLDRLVGEMTALFPDPYFHIGGDEVNGEQWKASPAVQAYMKTHGLKDTAALQALFTTKVQAIVAHHGKHAIGWDEIMDGDMPKDVVVQSWRDAESLRKAALAGHAGILSAPYYLDLSWPAGRHYAADPMPENLPVGLEGLILGGEACAWSERLSPENLDIRLWPRAAVVAEKLWSPKDMTGDVPAMYARLATVADDLAAAGSRHRAAHDAMLARVAGPAGVGAVWPLAQAVEPLKDYNRSTQRPDAVQSTPLNRLVDAIPAESAVAREFGLAVDRLIAQPGDTVARTQVRSLLERWRTAETLLAPFRQATPLLAELAGPAAKLTRLAEVGLAAADAVATGQPLAGRAAAEKALAEAAEPGAELEFAILPAVTRLVKAAR
ncbi:family 20 glycosylhydrolase [Nitrospirillum sp. BR 11164]|uniref:beta-N-acetylhexosaminidase n=1 Tax=Nitrospirillum sp. BR 11164 TaxID=3104324 RepID=UPI002AFDE5AF|nr:family 20 glycosylhydrolase [Nitrospirillum sp. BR 11164]MEA1649176.1 family 20 glycosylhydrolase [Nitrospirillum sp. BR 11164]